MSSKSSDAEFDLELHFLPAWAQETPDPNRYAKYAGESKRDERKGDFRDRPPRPRHDGGGGQQRPRRDGRPGGGPRDQSAGGGGGGRGPQRRGPGPQQRGDRGERSPEQRPAPVALPELNVAFKPDEKGVESLAKQIKMTGRAYPLFDIAQMILRKPERHSVTLSVKTKPDGQPVQPLFSCALDETVWLSEEEAVRYVLEKYFSTFYQPERIQIDPPKGTYTFVAQCGMSGVVLGPPNYHDYQNQLRKLHAERFSRMPFDAFKSRVKIVRDEAVVKKWLEDQSFKTEYVCLNLPEPLKLGSREEVEKHFRETHLANIIKSVNSFSLKGTASRTLQSPPLLRLVRFAWEDQKRFPLQIATVLSQQFASRGLQFFKVNRTVTHVSVARPHFLDLDAAPVSDSIKRIVTCLNATPRCTRRHLIAALLPGQPNIAKESPAAAEAAGATAPEPEPTPEVTALIADLHWLIHQGHVIEFANGTLETAKKPIVKPERPPPAQKAESAAKTVESTTPEGADPVITQDEAVAMGESSPEPAPADTAEGSEETPATASS